MCDTTHSNLWRDSFIRPTQSIMYVPIQINRFKKTILLIVQYKYLKSCSRRFYCPNLILCTRLCGTMFITQPSCLFDFRLTESVRRKWFVLAVYQHRKGISAGPALKYFTWFIGAGGYTKSRPHKCLEQVFWTFLKFYMCFTHERVMSYVWMSRVTHMKESCRRYERHDSLISRVTWYEWVMSHIYHVTHMIHERNLLQTHICHVTRVDESYRTHTWAHINESWYSYEWVIYTHKSWSQKGLEQNVLQVAIERMWGGKINVFHGDMTHFFRPCLIHVTNLCTHKHTQPLCESYMYIHAHKYIYTHTCMYMYVNICWYI